MRKIEGRALNYMGFIQSVLLLLYCSLIAALVTNGDKIFGKMPGFLGPLLFLLLFSTSAIICGLITLYFPFILFYYKKQTVQAAHLVFYTAKWSVLFTLIILLILFIRK